jgi:hypothetical protein
MALVRKLEGLWDPKKMQLAPPKAYTEVVEEWLEMIGSKMSQATATRRSARQWSSAYKNSPVPDGELNRKPDIALIRRGDDINNWQYIHTIAEVTSRPELHTHLKAQIDNKIYLMLSDQHTRRFVPFLAICGHIAFFLVSDREGQASAEIPYLQAGEYNALSFLRIIAGLTFGSQEVIGFDGTFQHLKPGDVDDVVGPAKQIGVSAGGKIYAIKSLVHAVRGVVGRSTRVWSGFDIKDPK